MPRPTSFGAQCEHGRLARKCERCDDADEIASLRDCAKQYEQWLAQDHATIADLRDRLRVMGCHLCRDCGCAPRDADMPRCWDCDDVRTVFEDRGDPQDSTPASAVVVGLRALFGRRILEGC